MFRTPFAVDGQPPRHVYHYLVQELSIGELIQRLQLDDDTQLT
jgi:hypothetical protein